MRNWRVWQRRGLVVGAALVVASSGPGPRALAADVSPEQRAAVEQLVDNAREQRRVGDFEGAIGSLKKALGIYSSPEILYSLARVYEDAGKLDISRTYFELCFGPAVDPELQQRARDGLARLDKVGQHGRLVLEVAPADAHVFIDGERWRLDASNGTNLTAGTHRLRVIHPQFAFHEQDVAIIGGQTLNVIVNLSERPKEVVRTVEVQAPKVVKTSEGVGFGAWPGVMLGTGLAAGGAGLYFFLSGTADWDGAREANPQTEAELQAAIDVRNRGTQKRTIGFVAMGVGGALLMTSVILFALETDGTTTPSTSGWVPSLGVERGGAQISLQGRF